MAFSVLLVVGALASPSEADADGRTIEQEVRRIQRESVDKTPVTPALNHALSALRRSERYLRRKNFRAAIAARRTAWAALELASRQLAYETAQRVRLRAYRSMAASINERRAARRALESALSQRARLGPREP
ncbi:MAG: hypothetical protein H6715_00125 [Myxococcales bacterium]|nr:hypothetical protein [Myxococcales bacterium]MCB9707370.1 hypothetical protein [Myxococcales bacterium]